MNPLRSLLVQILIPNLNILEIAIVVNQASVLGNTSLQLERLKQKKRDKYSKKSDSKSFHVTLHLDFTAKEG